MPCHCIMRSLRYMKDLHGKAKYGGYFVAVHPRLLTPPRHTRMLSWRQNLHVCLFVKSPKALSCPVLSPSERPTHPPWCPSPWSALPCAPWGSQTARSPCPLGPRCPDQAINPSINFIKQPAYSTKRARGGGAGGEGRERGKAGAEAARERRKRKPRTANEEWS